MKKTQLEMIREQLLNYGEVSRNWCLARYCSRLSARILDLEKDGWMFTTEKRNGDFFYLVAYIPESVKRSEAKNVLPQYAKEFTQLSLSM